MRVLNLYACRKHGTDAEINVCSGIMPSGMCVSLEFEELLPALGSDTPVRDGVSVMLSIAQVQELQRKIAALKIEALVKA